MEEGICKPVSDKGVYLKQDIRKHQQPNGKTATDLGPSQKKVFKWPISTGEAPQPRGTEMRAGLDHSHPPPTPGIRSWEEVQHLQE